MQLYTCCPHDTCGSFQSALNWLKSHGIEPSLEHDGKHHFFDFDVPENWKLEQRIEFRWELAHKTHGLVFCRCGEWLDENKEGQVGKLTCKDCGREYLFCEKCDAFEMWPGCDCRGDHQ